ncbi:MAG: ATP-binding protein [Acidobacteriota bacterium]
MPRDWLASIVRPATHHMRLTQKLTALLLVGILAVMAIYGALQVRREVRFFDIDMRRDARVFGRALAKSVAHVWVEEGEGPALDLVTQTGEPSSHVRVRWVWLDGPAEPAHVPRVPADQLGPVTRGQDYSTSVEPLGGMGTVYTYVPVPVPGVRHGALEIAESLEDEKRYTRRTIQNISIAVTMVVLVCGAMAALLGYVLVGKPTRQLVEKARRVGAGDLGSPLRSSNRDELGVLAGEMNAMSDQLLGARTKIQAETAARIAAMEQLRHADRLTTVGKLASGIAHELGTPLNVVGGRAQMIASGEVEGEEARAGALVVVEQARRMTQIIRQLLDFSRPRRAQKTRRDLRDIVAQTIGLLDPMARKRSISIELALPEGDVPAEVDEGQMQQVLTNLIVNAVQASPAGGTVTVAASREAAVPPADFGPRPGAWASVSVKDAGHGIAQNDLPRIFEPFFTTKGVGEGTGLGLSVAHGIVREHGGFLSVESVPGQGSTFRIFLPLGA